MLAKLDAEGVTGELQVREVREGRAEIVQMWGRPESVREEFRQRRSLSGGRVARVLAVVPDLMLSSRVVEALTAAGHEVEVSRRCRESSDADASSATSTRSSRPRSRRSGSPSLGFYSHVEVETRRAAEAAGVEWSCRARGWRGNYPRWWRLLRAVPFGVEAR